MLNFSTHKKYKAAKIIKKVGSRPTFLEIKIFQTSSGRSGSAVGLSAISFSAALQKDAAPIPNAGGMMSIEQRAMSKT